MPSYLGTTANVWTCSACSYWSWAWHEMLPGSFGPDLLRLVLPNGEADFLGPRHDINIRLFSVRISQWRSEEGSWYLIMRQKLWPPPSCPEGSMLQRCSARWAVNSNPICLASADLLWKSASVPATNSTPFWCKSHFYSSSKLCSSYKKILDEKIFLPTCL